MTATTKKTTTKKTTTKKAAPKTVVEAVKRGEAITTIALNMLRPDPENVRRFESESGIESLAQNIAACGLIHNLTVRKPTASEKAPKGVYYVTAGSRRLKALTHLKKEGATITAQGVKVTGDYPVRVQLLNSATVTATEASLSENYHRENMSALDEITAFKKMNEVDGKTPEQIADRFGVNHMTVRRRLKLANVSPTLLELFGKDEINLSQLEALASSDNHALQEEVWNSQSNRTPNHIRTALAPEAVAASDKMAIYVGLAAYKEAGGTVTLDLFDDSRTRLHDRALLVQMVSAKLQAEAEAARASYGFKWAGFMIEREDAFYSMARIYPKKSDVLASEADADRYTEIAERLAAIELEMEDEDAAHFDLEAEHSTLTEELKVIQSRASGYDDAEKQLAGVYATLNHDGSVTHILGVVRKEEAAELAKLQDRFVTTHTAPAQEAEEGLGYSDALTSDLVMTRSAALACEIAKRPDVALIILIHRLAGNHFYGFCRDSALVVSTSTVRRQPLTPDPANTKAFDTLAALDANWREILPKDVADLWDWCLDAKPAELNNLLAFCVGTQIEASAGGFKGDRPADRVAEAIGFKMEDYWTPSEGFGKRVSKKTMVAALKDAERPAEAIAVVEDSIKADAIQTFVEEAKAVKWLPPVLRIRPATHIASADLDEEDEAEGDDLHGEFSNE